jgi:LuxR family transcriptional regulator
VSQIRNYLRDLTNAPTAEALWDQHCSKMAEYGFDRILYGFSHFMSATSMGDPEDFIILTNHDRSYMDWFIGEGHFKHAPMVRWALANEGACSWSYL